MKLKTARRFLERNRWRLGALKTQGVAPTEKKKIAFLKHAVECEKRLKENK